MRIFILILSLAAAPAFAKIQQVAVRTESIALKFARSCAHALDAEEGQERLYREMQHWLGVYYQDPSSSLPSDHRLANALTELHDLALDRIADLPAVERGIYRGYLEQTKLADGHVPDEADTLIFLATLTDINLDLRRVKQPDLGGAAFAGIAISVINGMVLHEDVRVGVDDPDDIDTKHLVIEPAAHEAFNVVESTIDELRRGRGLEILRSTIVPHFAYRSAAAFEMVRNLEYARGEMPARIAECITRLGELRKTFDGDDGHEKVVEFKRMVSLLNEIHGYLKLSDQMGRIGVPTWTESFVVGR